MELGKKLLRARQEAGLSQRQLCGDVITRNMLSQIEHGTARPSMDTLRYLAARLGKPVGYFLDEDSTASPNQPAILAARQAYDAGDIPKARLLLENYRGPDPVFDGEYTFLQIMTTLKAAETALTQGKHIYARELLSEEWPWEQISGASRQRLLLLGRVEGQDPAAIAAQLPSLDEELHLRARGAMARGDTGRAIALLAAAEDRESPLWHLRMGQALTQDRQYAQGAQQLSAAEETFPRETAQLLETCFRELGDFQKAYFYACKQREK